MELVFVRHGHGEHLVDYPQRLDTLHPGLTDYGVHQIIQLRRQLRVCEDDLVIVSPTERTIQTAEILVSHNDFWVSPCVGPRMFPLQPANMELLCDRIYSRVEVEVANSGLGFVDLGLDLWDQGINKIEQVEFEHIAGQFLSWCNKKAKRTVIISHDGTITNYRLYLGEKNLTRADFLGEAGVYKASWERRE